MSYFVILKSLIKFIDLIVISKVSKYCNKSSWGDTVEPPYNEPLYNEVLGITNDFLYPSGNKTDEKGTSI